MLCIIMCVVRFIMLIWYPDTPIIMSKIVGEWFWSGIFDGFLMSFGTYLFYFSMVGLDQIE